MQRHTNINVVLAPGQIFGLGFCLQEYLPHDTWAVQYCEHGLVSYANLIAVDQKGNIVRRTFTVREQPRRLPKWHELRLTTDKGNALYIENAGPHDFHLFGAIAEPMLKSDGWAAPMFELAKDFYSKHSQRALCSVETAASEQQQASIDGILDDLIIEVARRDGDSQYVESLMGTPILRLDNTQSRAVEEIWVDREDDQIYLFAVFKNVSSWQTCRYDKESRQDWWLADSAFCNCDSCVYRHQIMRHPLFRAEIYSTNREDSVVVAFECPTIFVEAASELVRGYGFDIDGLFSDDTYYPELNFEYDPKTGRAVGYIYAPTDMDGWNQTSASYIDEDEFFDPNVLEHEREGDFSSGFGYLEWYDADQLDIDEPPVSEDTD